MLARDDRERLTDHNIVAGVASMALPGYKYAGYMSGMSKQALLSMILTGYMADLTVRPWVRRRTGHGKGR